MEAIAMKVNRKDFDSIKEFFTGSNIDFQYGNYLINTPTGIHFTYFGSRDCRGRVIYNSSDKDVFLKACDIEDFKKWSGREMQFQDEEGNWIDLASSLGTMYRFKPKANYSKEIEDLQKKATENGMRAIVTFEKL